MNIFTLPQTEESAINFLQSKSTVMDKKMGTKENKLIFA